MYRCRPAKWIIPAIVGVGLPFLAAVVVSGPLLKQALLSSTSNALATASGAWAKVDFNGRDARITGQAPDEEALNVALATVSQTPGIRIVSQTASIAPPVILDLPTIMALTTQDQTPELTGTWPQGAATTLTISLANKTFNFGSAAELTTSAGKWRLQTTIPLAPGTYDVALEISDGKKARQSIIAAKAITIEEPPKPAVEPVVAAEKPGVEAPPAPAPEIVEPEQKAEPKAEPGIVAAASKPIELPKAETAKVEPAIIEPPKVAEPVVAAVKPAPPKPVPLAAPIIIPAAAPYDCVDVLQRIAQVFPLRFAFDESAVLPNYDGSLNHYAALFKDPRCATLKAEVAGHADDRGSEDYNLALSDARADTVIAALLASGIDESRLVAKGYSDLKPLVSAHNEDAYAKNRRVEFNVLKAGEY
jgi:outer membrane protein OmpA-like peptidoglycan-associated protein